MARRPGRSHSVTQFGATTTTTGFGNAIAAQLRALGDAVESKCIRPAAYAGAKLLYDELKLRAPVGPTGKLNAAVYHWHDDKRSVDGQEWYAVGVNVKKAPHWALVEYGHWRVNKAVPIDGKLTFTKERLPAPVWVPAVPYLRPTADRMPDAIRAMQDRLAEKVRELSGALGVS